MYGYIHMEAGGLSALPSLVALHLIIYFDTESLSEPGAHWLVWLTRLLQGSDSLCSLHTSIKDGIPLCMAFMWVLGILTQVFMFTWQTLY